MDKEKYLIAVASSDGIIVNNHFGKAGTFYIYEADEAENIHLVEKRTVPPVCSWGNHDDEKLRENLRILNDCSYLLVSRIGNGAASMAESFGIESYEIPGEIKKSINQLIKYRKVKKLFG